MATPASKLGQLWQQHFGTVLDSSGGTHATHTIPYYRSVDQSERKMGTLVAQEAQLMELRTRIVGYLESTASGVVKKQGPETAEEFRTLVKNFLAEPSGIVKPDKVTPYTRGEIIDTAPGFFGRSSAKDRLSKFVEAVERDFAASARSTSTPSMGRGGAAS